MVALETAAELWMSLTDSGQTQWLEYSGFAGEMLLEEVTMGVTVYMPYRYITNKYKSTLLTSLHRSIPVQRRHGTL